MKTRYERKLDEKIETTRTLLEKHAANHEIDEYLKVKKEYSLLIYRKQAQKRQISVLESNSIVPRQMSPQYLNVN